MDIFNRARFTTKLNQVQHEFEVYLDSSAGETDSPENKYPINPNAIVNLTIEDTLADWVVRGSLTFFYNPESGSIKPSNTTQEIQRAANKFQLQNLPSYREQPFYSFRNDGYDLLRIRIKPLLDKNTQIPNSTTITDPVHWSLSYLFSIYDVEDIDLPPGAQNQASSYIKCLKVYFWDSWYQKLNTNLIEYSTALSPYANIEQDIQEGIYNNPGNLPTGQAMREIINTGLSQNSYQESYSNVTYVDPALRVNYEPIKNEEWEEGAAKIFYTAPAQNTAFDNLMYIYDKHVSNDAYSISPTQSAPRGGTPDTKLYDFSILIKDRGPKETDVGQFTLKSVASYFQKAGSQSSQPGPYQYEHFFLQSYSDTTNNPTKTTRAPLSKSINDTVDFKSLKYNTITNYRFVDISAFTNSKTFVNSPVYSFDFTNRTFNVEFKNNSVLTARKVMAEKYIKPLYKKDSDLEKLSLINIYKDKENKNISPQFSLYGDNPAIRQHAGLQRLLYIGLFQNSAINFRTLGLTFREPGRFIGIDRTEGVKEGDFEDKFYGQWFVINVKHVIESEIYYNDITAIKIHRFQTPFVNFPGII